MIFPGGRVSKGHSARLRLAVDDMCACLMLKEWLDYAEERRRAYRPHILDH